MDKLKRASLLADLHFGRKNNSRIHNEDCKQYIDWFLSNCKNHNIDHIVFLGDWFEERDSINSLTSKYGMDAANALNEFGVPVFFIIGNHDLYYRDNRDVYASYAYKHLNNFIIVDAPIVYTETYKKTLFTPFLFEDEYSTLSSYFDIPIWMGHFEFKGFVITGDTIVKESGPDPNNFSIPDHIFSGHFHKRQQSKNITYIGNAFPMDFGDANDNDRGMAIYDYITDHIEFINWEECPKYVKINLSDIINDKITIDENARVRCIADTDITYTQSSEIKQTILDKYNLREFNIEEIIKPIEMTSELTAEEIRTESINSLVRKLLNRIESEQIDSEILVKIYDDLK